MVSFTRQDVPHSPGVYFFKDKKGKVLYVGKATNLRNRVISYFRANSAESDGSGLRFPLPPNPNLPMIKQRLINETRKIDWKETPSEIEALLQESHYIKKYQPRYNVILRDDKTYLSVKITDEEYPRVLTTRKIEKDGTYFGPFTDARAVKETLKILRRFFPYRTNCSPFVASPRSSEASSEGEAKQGQPNSGRSCLYYHLGLCPGVCVGKMTASEYRLQIKHIKNFLQGKPQKIISGLKGELKTLRQRNDEESIRRAGNIEYKIKNLEKVLAMSHVLFFGEKID